MGATMTISDADLEFGMVWDADQNGFDVTMRFTSAAGEDRRPASPRRSLQIDLAALDELVDDTAAYGAALSRMVFAVPEIESLYSHALAAAQTAMVHLRIHLDGPARYHAVRWELLREAGEEGMPIATTPNILFSRFLSSTDWRPIPTGDQREHRALVVVAAPSNADEYGLAEVDVDVELARARRALTGYQLDVLGGGRRRATLASLAEQLGTTPGGYEVLYLVGHGRLTDDVPLLFLERDDGTADAVDARRLVERVYGLEQKPTIAMLLSCQSGASGDDAASSDGGALAGIGPRLSGAGIPAVIAMQGDVTMATAASFTTAFFTAFGEAPVVDRAMARARTAVLDRPDWWMPVLFSRLRSGRVYNGTELPGRDDDTWRTLDTMLSRRKVTPVLGPGLADRILGSKSAIAHRWVRRWQMPITLHGQSNLAQVAQYLRVGRSPGLVRAYLEEYLMTDLRERRETAGPGDPLHELPDALFEGTDPSPVIHELGRWLRENDEGDPYRVVSGLDAPVFVTTSWTDLLQEAMRERRKQPRTFCFPWYRGSGWRDVEGNDVATWPAPSVDEPWVCHLFGRLDEPTSLVLTEDDYFSWLSSWIAQRPNMPRALSALSKALTLQSLLFLGYQLGDWDFRVVFQSIRSFGGSDLLRDNLHIGVQLRPEVETVEPEAAQRYLESYFGNDNVKLFWSDTRTFLDELRKHIELPT